MSNCQGNNRKVGTKSVLVGVHAFWWHPITVLLAWIELYGFPNLKELVCIFIHDLGYFGKPNMDGAEGESHPILAADWAIAHLDGFPKGTLMNPEFLFYRYHNLCLFHSRTCAKKYGREPSKLCWADKLSIKYDPCWFYLIRARLSGELAEYRADAAKYGFVPAEDSDREWFAWTRERGIRAGRSKNPSPVYEGGKKNGVL